jgi:hypothetical protein
VTPNDLLAIAVQRFPGERFVYCAPRRNLAIGTHLEAGEVVTVAGIETVISEWNCDRKGRRLSAELRTWVPRSGLTRGLNQHFSAITPQPVVAAELREHTSEKDRS